MKRLFASILLLALWAGCDSNILNTPLGSISVTTTTPSVTPTTTSAAIAWTSNVATRHQIEYGTASGTYTKASLLSTSESSSHSVSLTNLNPVTTYYYKITSYYQTSFQVTSQEYSFTTASVGAVTISAGPTATPATTSASITWTTSSAVDHQIEYGTSSGNYTMATIMTNSTATSHTESLTGLTPGTTYYYRIRSNDAGTITLHTEASFTATAFAFSVALATSNLTTTSVDITWTSNIATKAILEYGTSTGTYTSATSIDSSFTTAHTKSLSSLSSGTTYYYRIQSYTASNGNFTSSESTFSTTAVTEPSSTTKTNGIWVVGGLSGSTISTTVTALDLYNPTTDTWYSNVASGATGTYVPVSHAGVVGYNGKIYVIGGFDSTGTVRDLVQIYTISSNAWSTGTVIPSARANVKAVLVTNPISGNFIYVVSGTTGNASAAWAGANTTYEYNIAGNSWATRTAPGFTGSERNAVFFNDVLYTLGGRTAAATLSTTHDGYVYTSNALTTGITEVVLTAAKSGAVLDVYQPATGPAVMVLVGGATVMTGTTGCWPFQGTTTYTTTNNVQFLFFPFSAPSTWLSGTGTLSATVGHASGVMVGSKLYHFGGTSVIAPNPLNTVSYTDLAAITPSNLANSWTSRTAMPTARYGHTAVKIQ